MITPWEVYWITRLDYIQCFFGVTATILGLTAIAWFVGGAIGGQNEKRCCDEYKPFYSPTKCFIRCKLSVVTTVLFVIIACLIPSSKEMAAILVIPKIANNQQVQDLGKNLVDLANQWLIELRPKTNEKTN